MGDATNVKFSEKPVMQTHCVHCGTEQNVVSVYLISLGKASCSFCGKYSKIMTEKEYQEYSRG